MPAYLVVVIDLGAVLMAACVAVAIVRVIGKGRLGRWLRLDVTDADR